MNLLLVVIVVAGVFFVVRAVSVSRQHQALHHRAAADLEALRRVADEDVTRFGEELQRLDRDLCAVPLDEAMRQDYQGALDSYEAAKQSLALATQPDDVRHVTRALEDGRYAAACVLARRDGRPLPLRRPPCFFNPGHGPSTRDLEWAPPGGVRRSVPVCAADADRVAQGVEPDIRTVPQGPGRVPYWQGGAAWAPWASGYFAGYATSGLLPAVLVTGLLDPGWDGGPDGWDDGGLHGWDLGPGEVAAFDPDHRGDVGPGDLDDLGADDLGASDLGDLGGFEV